MPIVDARDLGLIEFPDSWSQEQIQDFLKKQFSSMRLTGEPVKEELPPFAPPSMTPVRAGGVTIPQMDVPPQTDIPDKKPTVESDIDLFAQEKKLHDEEVARMLEEKAKEDSLTPPESGIGTQAALGSFAGVYEGVGGLLRGLGAAMEVGLAGGGGAGGAFIPLNVAQEIKQRAKRTKAEFIQDVKENPITLLGQAVPEYWSETIPRTEAEKRTFVSQTAEQAGSMAPYLAMGKFFPLAMAAESFADHIINDGEELKSQHPEMTEDQIADVVMGRALASGALQGSIFALLPKYLRKAGEKVIVDQVGEAGLKRFLAKRTASAAEVTALFSTSHAAENVVMGENPWKNLAPTVASGILFGAFLTPYSTKKDAEVRQRKQEAQRGTVKYKVVTRQTLADGTDRVVIKTATKELVFEDTPENIDKIVAKATEPATTEERAAREKMMEDKLKQTGFQYRMLDTLIPGKKNRIAQVGNDKVINVSKPRLHDYLELYIADGLGIEEAIDKVIAHEAIHSGTKILPQGDAMAAGFWDNMTRLEKSLLSSLLIGPIPRKPGAERDLWMAEVSNSENMGHEAIRFFLERAGGLDPSEFVGLTRRAKFRPQTVAKIADVVFWIRETLGTKASESQRDLLNKVTASVEAAKKGTLDASKVTQTAEVHGDVRPQQEPTRTVPVQEGGPRVQPQAGGGLPLEGQKEILLTPQKDRSKITLKDLPVVEEVPAGSIDPETLIPAVRLIDGDVIHGWVKKNGKVSTHPEIIQLYGIKHKEWDRKGFVDRQGTTFYGRKPAAKGTQLPTDKKEGELHSTDLPKKQKKVAPAVQPVEPPKTAQATGAATVTGGTAPVGPAIRTPTPEGRKLQAQQEFDKFRSELAARMAAGGKKRIEDHRRYKELMEAAAKEEVDRLEQERQAAGGTALPGTEPPEGPVETAAGMEMRDPPDANILVFHGEGAEGGAGKGEAWYTTNFARALHFGGKISYMRLTPEEAKRFQQPIRTDFIVGPDTLQRSRTLDRTFQQRVEDLDALGMDMRDAESDLPIYSPADWRRYSELADIMKTRPTTDEFARSDPKVQAFMGAWAQREAVKNLYRGESPAQMNWDKEKLDRWESQQAAGMAMKEASKEDIERLKVRIREIAKDLKVDEKQIDAAATKIASLGTLEERQYAIGKVADQIRAYQNREAAEQALAGAKMAEAIGRPEEEVKMMLERAIVKEARAARAEKGGKDPAQAAAELDTMIVSVLRRYFNMPIEPVPAKPTKAQVSKWRKFREELHMTDPYPMEQEQRLSALKVRFTTPEYERIRNALRDQMIGDPSIKIEIIKKHYTEEVQPFIQYASSETLRNLLKGYRMASKVPGPIAEPEIGRAWTTAEQKKSLTQLAADVPEVELKRFANARNIDTTKPDWDNKARKLIVEKMKAEAAQYAEATAVPEPELTRKEGKVAFYSGRRGMTNVELEQFREAQRRGLQREWQRGFERARDNRAKAQSLLLERMMAGVRADERSPTRNALTLEDLYRNIHTKVGVYTEFTPEMGNDYKWLSANLDEEAAGSPASTHRITLLENRENHNIEAVATYRELRSKEIMLYDPDRAPGDRTGNFYRLEDVLKFFQPRGTILVQDPVNRFHQRWASTDKEPGWAVYKKAFGNDAETKEGGGMDWASLQRRYEREKLFGHRRARAEQFELTERENQLWEKLEQRYAENPATMPPTGMRALNVLRQMREESQKIKDAIAKKEGLPKEIADEKTENDAAWNELELSDAIQSFNRLTEFWESEEVPGVEDLIRERGEAATAVDPEIEPIRDPLSLGRRSFWELHRLGFIRKTVSMPELQAMARFFNEHNILQPADIKTALEGMAKESRKLDERTKQPRGWKGRDFCVASFLDKVFLQKHVETLHLITGQPGGVREELMAFAKGNNRKKKTYLSTDEARKDYYEELRTQAYEETLDLIYAIAQKARRGKDKFKRAKTYNEQQIVSALLDGYGDTFRRDLEQLALSKKRAAAFLQRGLQPGEVRFGRAGTPEPVQPELFAGFGLERPLPEGAIRRELEKPETAIPSGFIGRPEALRPEPGRMLTGTEQMLLSQRPRMKEAKLLQSGELIPGRPEPLTGAYPPRPTVTTGEIPSTGRMKRSPFPRPRLPTERLYPGGIPRQGTEGYVPRAGAPEGYVPTRGGQYEMESILREATPAGRYLLRNLIEGNPAHRKKGDPNPLGMDMKDTMIGVARRYTDALEKRGLFVVNREGENTVSPEESLSIPEWFQVGDRLREMGANAEAIMQFSERMTARGQPGSLGTKEQAVCRSYIHELFETCEQIREDHPIGSPEYQEVSKDLGDFLGRFQRQIAHERGVQLAMLGGTYDFESGSYESMRRYAKEQKDGELDSEEDAEVESFANRMRKARKATRRAQRAVTKIVSDPKSQLDPAQKALADKVAEAFSSFVDVATAEAELKKRHGEIGPSMAMRGEERPDEAPLSEADLDALSRIGGQLMMNMSRRGELTESDWKLAMMKDKGSIIVTEKNLNAIYDNSEKLVNSFILHELGITPETEPARISLTLKKTTADVSAIFVQRAVEMDPHGKKITVPEAFHLWNYLKEKFIRPGRPESEGGGKYTFEELIYLASQDLGIPAERIYKGITTKKSFRKITTELYNRMREERAVMNQARNWMQALKYPKFTRWSRFVPRLFFIDKVIGHALVPMETHASQLLFNPGAWKTYFPAWRDMYNMTFDGDYHIQRMYELQRHPNYREAIEAGLEVNPFIFTDDYLVANIRKWFGKKAPSLISGRGFDALKTLRMARYMQLREKLPMNLRTKKMFALLAHDVNASTGIIHTKRPIPEPFYWTFFAPKLTLSQWSWLFGQPLHAADIFARATGVFGKSQKPTAEEMYWARSEFKQKVSTAAVYLSLLVMNQGFLKAIGSDQDINFWNPRRGDFWQFKVAGFRLGLASPIIGLVRFVADMLYLFRGQKKGIQKGLSREEIQSAREMSYLKTRLSPFASFSRGIYSGADFKGRLYPFSPDEPSRSQLLRGESKMGWAEYGTTTFFPIPLEEMAREVFEAQGMNELTANKVIRALISAAAMTATGARVAQDVYVDR